MNNVALGNVILFSFVFCLTLAAETIDSCGNGAFQLSLFGRKREDDQWNTTYRLERFSCNTTKNWNLIIQQNITDSGNMQKIYLRGYFTENVNDTFENGSLPVALSSAGRVLSLVPSLEGGSIGKSECPKVSEGSKLKVVTRYAWNARMANKSAPVSLTQPIKRVYIYSIKESNCTVFNECVIEMQKLQDEEIKEYGHIYANFHAAGDGRIYEGLGWNTSRDQDLNLKYLISSPTPQNMASFALLIREGVRTGKISKDYTLAGDRSEVTKKWITWVDDVYGD